VLAAPTGASTIDDFVLLLSSNLRIAFASLKGCKRRIDTAVGSERLPIDVVALFCFFPLTFV